MQGRLNDLRWKGFHQWFVKGQKQENAIIKHTPYLTFRLKQFLQYTDYHNFCERNRKDDLLLNVNGDRGISIFFSRIKLGLFYNFIKAPFLLLAYVDLVCRKVIFSVVSVSQSVYGSPHVTDHLRPLPPIHMGSPSPNPPPLTHIGTPSLGPVQICPPGTTLDNLFTM